MERGSINNSQQSQQINLLDEGLTELNTSFVDCQSTVGSTFSEAVRNDGTTVENIAGTSTSIPYRSQSTTSFPATENDSWLIPECLQDMAATLESSQDDPEALADLRECWPQHALEAACKLLKPETRQRIRQWILAQNPVVMDNTQFVRGAQVKVGDHYGTLAAQTPSGKWLIEWEKQSSSQQKRYGEPPVGAIAANLIEIIEVVTD